jgi:hypothetical protein
VTHYAQVTGFQAFPEVEADMGVGVSCDGLQ